MRKLISLGAAVTLLTGAAAAGLGGNIASVHAAGTCPAVDPAGPAQHVCQSTLTVTAGATGLSITNPNPGGFTATLGGGDQTAYSTLAGYTASDTTGTGNGWNVTFQATKFYNSAKSDTLPGPLTMAPASAVAATGTSGTGRAAAPAASMPSNANLDNTATGSTPGTAVKVFSAAKDTGMGTYNLTPGNVDGTAGHNLSLFVPSYTYAGSYVATVTMTISSAP